MNEESLKIIKNIVMKEACMRSQSDTDKLAEYLFKIEFFNNNLSLFLDETITDKLLDILHYQEYSKNKVISTQG